ncbi:MAG: ACP S-malonyltransferase [Pseudomonadota bacterium]
MSHAFVFPGQGSQTIGMAQALAEAHPAAQAVLDEVDDILEQNLSGLMFEGPIEDLTLTENAQPALMAASIAVVRVLAESGVAMENAGFLAGHSLGEYTALCAAGTLSLADTARLLKLRGQAMQRAVPVGEGAMAALLGLDTDAASDVAQAAGQHGVCTVANDNAAGQVVISGAKAAIEAAIDIAKDKGARKAMLLPVSAPFHCPLMQPAADEMAAALAEVEFHAPMRPVVANVTASAVEDPEVLRRLLVEQVTGVVRWRESVMWMAAQGVTRQIELGSGKVLSGLVRRIDKSITASNIGTPDELDAFLAAQE